MLTTFSVPQPITWIMWSGSGKLNKNDPKRQKPSLGINYLMWTLRFQFGPSANTEGEGLINYTASSHQGAMKMFHFHFSELSCRPSLKMSHRLRLQNFLKILLKQEVYLLTKTKFWVSRSGEETRSAYLRRLQGGKAFPRLRRVNLPHFPFPVPRREEKNGRKQDVRLQEVECDQLTSFHCSCRQSADAL